MLKQWTELTEWDRPSKSRCIGSSLEGPSKSESCSLHGRRRMYVAKTGFPPAVTYTQVQDIVVGTKSLTDVAKPSEIVSLFMDDEELAESVAKRKQAEAHGYVAPSITTTRKSAFGDGVGGGDDDEDDFFSLKKRPANGEDEDFGDEQGGKSGRATPKEGAAKKKSTAPTTKRKAPDGELPDLASKEAHTQAMGTRSPRRRESRLPWAQMDFPSSSQTFRRLKEEGDESMGTTSLVGVPLRRVYSTLKHTSLESSLYV